MADDALGDGRMRHVDIVSMDPLSSSFRLGAKLIKRTQPDDPTISAQIREGWATYVYMTEPHTTADCPFDEDGRIKERSASGPSGG